MKKKQIILSKEKRGNKNDKSWKPCGCTHTHTHTSKLIQINKGANAFISSDIKDRLLSER